MCLLLPAPAMRRPSTPGQRHKPPKLPKQVRGSSSSVDARTGRQRLAIGYTAAWAPSQRLVCIPNMLGWVLVDLIPAPPAPGQGRSPDCTYLQRRPRRTFKATEAHSRWTRHASSPQPTPFPQASCLRRTLCTAASASLWTRLPRPTELATDTKLNCWWPGLTGDTAASPRQAALPLLPFPCRGLPHKALAWRTTLAHTPSLAVRRWGDARQLCPSELGCPLAAACATAAHAHKHPLYMPSRWLPSRLSAHPPPSAPSASRKCLPRP